MGMFGGPELQFCQGSQFEIVSLIQGRTDQSDPESKETPKKVGFWSCKGPDTGDVGVARALQRSFGSCKGPELEQVCMPLNASFIDLTIFLKSSLKAQGRS